MTFQHARIKLISVATLAALIAGCSGDEKKPPVDTNLPKINSFTAMPTTVARGGRVTLSWNVEKAESITISATPNGVLVDASTMLVGTVESAPVNENTVFQLVATDAAGKTTDQTVNVTVDANAVQVVSFTA